MSLPHEHICYLEAFSCTFCLLMYSLQLPLFFCSLFHLCCPLLLLLLIALWTVALDGSCWLKAGVEAERLQFWVTAAASCCSFTTALTLLANQPTRPLEIFLPQKNIIICDWSQLTFYLEPDPSGSSWSNWSNEWNMHSANTCCRNWATLKLQWPNSVVVKSWKKYLTF